MKNTARLLGSWLLTACVLLGLIGLFSAAPSNLFAQAADAAVSTGALLDATVSLPQAIIALVVPLLVAGLKKLVPVIPKLWLPILAAVLGAIGEIINSFASGGSANVWLGLGLGLAGVGVREATKQFKAAAATPAPALD